jgi:outer membrane protein TolC
VQSAEAQTRQSGVSGSVSGSAGVAGVAPHSGDTIFSYPWNLQLNLRFAGLWGEASDTRVQGLLNLERAKRALVTARIRALVQAVNLWHGLRRGLVSLEVAQLALDLAVLEDQAAEVRFGTGAISISDRERVDLTLEVARLEFAQAQIAVSGARLQLEVLFGLRDVVPKDDWQVLSEPVVSNLEAREDVFEAQSSLKLADLQRGAAQRELLPTLNLETSIRGSSGLLSFSANQFLALSVAYSYPVALPVGVSSSFSIGLNLSIPI